MTTGKKKLGRNEPCWCGSGKLYKHCHRREDLAKEKQAKREARAAQAQEEAMKAAQRASESAWSELDELESFDAPPISPEVAAANARWQQFEAANLEGKIAIFQATLDSGEMDTEEAFEMTQGVRDRLDPHGDPAGRVRYAELLDQLRHQAPDLYAHDVAYYASNLIDDAIADERWQTLPELLTDYAQKPDIDIFLNIMTDQMLYFNQVQPLRVAMEQMWLWVSESGKVTPWGVDEFSALLLLVILWDYLDTTESPRADDPALHKAVAPYGRFNTEWLETTIGRLSAPAPVAWQPADFAETVDAEQWSCNLRDLMFDFMADQRRRAAVPFSKSYMMVGELSEFLEQQLASPKSPAQPPGRRRRSRKRRAKHRHSLVPLPLSSLVPRRAPLDRFLAENLRFLGARPYKVGAITELLPAYLHFLARAGAIHPTEMDASLDELRSMVSDAIRALDSHGVAPHLVWAVDEAWSREALTALRKDPVLVEARAKPFVAPSPPPKPAKQPGSLQTFTFKVTYLRDPDVWRMIEIAEHQTLDDLHHAIQRAVDFDADHLYSFFMSNRAWDKSTEYASPHADGPSATRIKIGGLRLRMKQRFLYLFDYGDEHRFEVQLVATNSDAPKDRYPQMVGSHGKAPSQYGRWEDEEDWDEEDDWDEDWQ